MRKLTLSFLLLIIIGISPIYAFQSFPVGMYFVGEDAEDLEMLAEGNVKYVFANRGINDANNISYYEDFIKNADNASSVTGSEIYIYVQARFKATASWDDEISQSEFEDLTDNITQILDIQDSLLTNDIIESNRIRGWFIADEPLKFHYGAELENNPDYDIPVVQLESYYNNLKTFLSNWDNGNGYEYDKMVVTEGSSIWNVLDPNPNDLFVRQDYSMYAAAFDEIHINYYFSDINIESTNLYNYESFDYDNNWPTGWYANQDEGSMRAFSLIWQRVIFDGLVSDPSKNIYMMLPLGETSNMHGKISHGKTHAGIKKVRDLGFDGVSFYVWKEGSTHDDDAYGNWTDPQYNYVEAVYNEVRDNDWLITSWINSSGSQKITSLSDRDGGQLPLDLSNNYNKTHNTVINHLATGDLWGEEVSDSTFVINNSSNRKSIADGDDELIYTTSDGDFWISEENHVDSEFGDLLNSDQNVASNEEITAMTTGDFDGDGDSEVITAIKKTNMSNPETTIYSSRDGNNFKQHSLETLSQNVDVTALAAGDFDGSGRDKLVVATYNEGSSDLYIYLSDIAEGEDPTATAITSSTSASNYVSDFAVGDFNGDNKEELATAVRNSNGTYGALCVSNPKPGGALGNPLWGYNRLWDTPSGTDEIVSAIAAGDFYNERKDRLITIIWDSNANQSKIYESVPVFPGSQQYDSWDGDPTDATFISSTSWHATAMNAGSFRESLLSGGASKIIAQNPESDSEVVIQYTLEQNYPNPFNPVTTINYSIPQSQQVKLQVFDILGRLIATLVNERKQAGAHSVNFDASSLSSGVYIYKIEAGTFTQTKKFTLIK